MLEHVRIESLKGTTYYAIVRLTSGAELDARPSDALALAVRMGSPIFATEEVMNKGGVEIPEQLRETAPLGRGIDAIVREVEGKAVRTTEAQLRHLVAFVFGTEITFAQEGHGE
jgi:bifunctional DNase/RNase